MPSGNRWSREEVLLALHLYERIDFGQQHSANPEVVRLAEVLGRTPGSVAMKLNNLSSLDPAERARGIRGLPGASNLDRETWKEFHDPAGVTIAESELLWSRRVEDEPASDDDGGGDGDSISGPGETDRRAEVIRRAGQDYFRRTVLAIYGGKCCLTGMPVADVLNASHIKPWSVDRENRLNPANGLCLARTQDAAFDAGLITFDEERRMVVSRRLRDFLPHEEARVCFGRFEGRPFRLPIKHFPREDFLAWHREVQFDR